MLENAVIPGGTGKLFLNEQDATVRMSIDD